MPKFNESATAQAAKVLQEACDGLFTRTPAKDSKTGQEYRENTRALLLAQNALNDSFLPQGADPTALIPIVNFTINRAKADPLPVADATAHTLHQTWKLLTAHIRHNTGAAAPMGPNQTEVAMRDITPPQELTLTYTHQVTANPREIERPKGDWEAPKKTRR